MQSKNLIPLEDTHVGLIDNGVPPAKQTMTKEKVFWAFFGGNINTGPWLFGVLAAQGLSFYWALCAMILGTLLGALPSALCALMGPPTRLSALETSRFSLGRGAVKLPAFLNWVNSIGWDAVNDIPAALALVALTGIWWKPPAPFWLVLALLAGFQMIVAIYGHHFVQLITKYMGFVLFLMFTFIGVRAAMHVGLAPLHQPSLFSAKAFALSTSLMAIGVGCWLPYAADYTRYLPAATPKKAIFWRVFAGLFFSCISLEIFGLLTASTVKDATPDGIIASMQHLAGAFAPLALLTAGLSVIPANAINDNSAAYCLVSAGLRIARPISALVTGIVGYLLALYGAQHLSMIVNVLLLLFYWVAPWAAIVLVHYFKTGMKESTYATGWKTGATVFCLVTVVTIALFSSNELYTGPIAKALGGIDIGFYVGFFAAGLLYWLALQFGVTTDREPMAVPPADR